MARPHLLKISAVISARMRSRIAYEQLLPQKGYCPVQMISQHPEQAVNSRLRMREVLKKEAASQKELIEGLGIEEDWKNRFPQELSGENFRDFVLQEHWEVEQISALR